MTVKECIEMYKHRLVNKKVTRLWLCPHIVNDPKIGQEYTAETSINTNQLTESLLNTKVRKHWIDNQETLCIVFEYDQNGPNFFVKNDGSQIDEVLNN